MTGIRKILVWLITIFIQSYVFLIWESVTLLILSQRYKWNSWKDNAGECCVWKSFFYYLLLNIWRVFASMKYFCYWNFPAFLGNWFLFYKFITIHQFTIYILYIQYIYIYILLLPLITVSKKQNKPFKWLNLC